MSIEAFPADLQQIISDISANETRAGEIISGLSRDQLNWQPNGGKSWSIAQCLEHLTLSHKAYLDVMWPVIRRASAPRRDPIQPGLFGGIFLRMLAPPVKMKAPAPPQIQPVSNADPDEVIAGWTEAHNGIREFVTFSAPFDLNSLTMQNPFVKQIRVKFSTALLIMVTHERRHLWQAAEVLKAMKSAGK